MEPSSPGSVFAGDRLDDDDYEASSDFDTHITSMPRECDSTELNVTKVNRLLRPLKAKCTHLSNIGEAFLPVSDNTGPRMITTYSHRRVYRPANHQESTVPPLAVFAEPELILRRPKPVVDAGTLELSRRVYHVRDCFKRILDTLYREDELTEVTSSVRDKRRASRLQRTTSSRRDVTSPGSSAPTERIPSLRDLCSVVAGRNMKLEKPDLEWEGEETREETDTVGVDEETEIIDELYNSILPPYRRRTLVSHALTHILETDRVNRNQTLLSSLLSITLSHKPPLIPETHAIVRAMLVSALTTSRTKKNSSPPICHISHASWLDDLHCLCCAPPKREPLADISSLPAKKQTTHIPTRSLLGMFLDVLRTSSAEDATAVWLSKATHRLLHRLRKTDGPSYFYLLTGMADCVARRPGDTDNCDLRKTFAGIMQGLVQWLLAPPPSSSGPPSPDLGRRSLLRVKDDLSSPVRAAPVRRPSHLEERPVTPDDFQGLIDFLIYTSSCGLHTSVSPGLAATKDAVICLTAICVATDPVPEAGISHSDKNGLEAVLKAAKPTPSVFEYLAEGMLSGALHIPFAESLVEISPNAHIANESHQLFLAFASGLHELDLRKLEAAWWVSALKAFEQTYEQTFRSSSTLFTSQDESERWEECKLLLIDEVERSERAAFAGKRGRDGDAEEEWEWEEMIGCWVRKTESPGEARMPKRRKLKRVVPQPVREEDDYSSTLACSDPLALPGAETSSPDPIASFTKARAVALSDIGSPCPKALNGTRAHARSSSSPAEIAPIGSARYLPDSDSPESNPWVVNAIEPELPTVDLFPSSDDTLDLFAYGSSSP